MEDEKKFKDNLECIDGVIKQHTNLVNLGKKYVSSCVKSFHREKKLFIYGTKDTEGHYLREDGQSVYDTYLKVSKLDPKYIDHIKNMKTHIDDMDQNINFFN